VTITLWLVRREFWENKAIWIIPAALGALVTLGSLFGTIQATFFDSTGEPPSMAGMMLLAFGALFFAAMSFYSYWYLLDCLYAERKDRSVLFWKSLPVSDTQTVLSKLLVALVAIPLVYFAADDATSLLVAFVLSVRTHSVLALWHPSVWLQLQAAWLYAIVTTAIWYLPITGWLLLVSAWARRAVILWSLVPPLGLMLAERLLLGTHAVSSVIADRLTGYASRAFSAPLPAGGWSAGQGFAAPTVWPLLNPTTFFSSPDTWLGALAGAVLIAATIQVRARRVDY
jgi:ABC-2 type transport system permease protein